MPATHSPHPSHPAGGIVALVVDVDGVVSAVHPDGDVWGDEVTAGNLIGPVRVSPTLCRRLDELGALPHVVPLWLTSWSAESRTRMDPFPGRNWAAVAEQEDFGDAELDEDRLGWWKWDALREWLEQHRDVRYLVWCDDYLSQPLWDDAVDAHELGEAAGKGPRRRPLTSALEPEDAPFLTTTAELIAPRLAHLGVSATLVAPATAVGLRDHDLDRVEAALLAAQHS